MVERNRLVLGLEEEIHEGVAMQEVVCSHFWWCEIALACEASSPLLFIKYCLAGLCLLPWGFYLLFFFRRYHCWSLCAEIVPSCWVAQFWHLAILGFLLSSLHEESESLSNWSTCWHAAFCALQSCGLFICLAVVRWNLSCETGLCCAYI